MRKSTEIAQIFEQQVFIAFYDKARNKLYLHSTDDQFCHKDVTNLIDESLVYDNKPCVTVYSDQQPKKEKDSGLPEFLLPEYESSIASNTKRLARRKKMKMRVRFEDKNSPVLSP